MTTRDNRDWWSIAIALVFSLDEQTLSCATMRENQSTHLENLQAVSQVM